MLKEWINEKYVTAAKISQIKGNFLKENPYKYFVLNNFFNGYRLKSLKKAVLKLNFKKIDRDLFSLSHTNDLKYSENEIIHDFCKFISSKEFISLIEKLTGEKLSNKVDIQSHAMSHGDYLLFHDDLVEGRKIAYVIYLSTLKSYEGGRLQLYNIKEPLSPVKNINPEFSTFVCFKVSNASMHTVEEIKSGKIRLTIGGWFYGN